MGLKERVFSTVVKNLMTALSFGGGSLLMSHGRALSISSGVLPMQVVMK